MYASQTSKAIESFGSGVEGLLVKHGKGVIGEWESGLTHEATMLPLRHTKSTKNYEIWCPEHVPEHLCL